MHTKINRRRFLANSAAGGAGLLVLPNSLSARTYQANEKLDVALIGVGSRGQSHWVKAIVALSHSLTNPHPTRDRISRPLPAIHPAWR